MSWKDHVPVLGSLRKIQGWGRRNKGWIYLALAVAVLFVVGPLLRIVATIFDILRPLITALLDNPVGRLLFYNALALLLLWLVWRKVRAGFHRLFGLRAMRHFLDGLHQMVLGRWRRAVDCFLSVEKIARWVRLEDAVPEHRDIRADAWLKIATCELRLGRPNEARAWLLRLREGQILTDHVRRNHAELRALSYDLDDELEAETVLRELEKTAKADQSNRRILLALRDRLEATGDLERTATVARRLAAVSEGREQEEAEAYVALLDFRRAHKALDEGDRKRTLKALKARTGDGRSALLLGDLAIESGDLAGALKAWGRAVSLPVFDRIADLLRSGRLDGDREKELLLKHFPYAGTMIALAEHYRTKGDTRKAKAALDKVLASSGGNMTVLRLYASCLEAEGDAAAAGDLYRRALEAAL